MEHCGSAIHDYPSLLSYHLSLYFTGEKFLLSQVIRFLTKISTLLFVIISTQKPCVRDFFRTIGIIIILHL